MTPTRRDFEDRLEQIFREEAERRRAYVDVEAADLHRVVGGYPAAKGNHRVSICCGVMWAARRADDEVLSSPPNRFGAAFRIRYRLPRPASANRGHHRIVEPYRVVETIHQTREPSTRAQAIALVSCVGKKRAVPSLARDLYTSPLFKGMRLFAETHAGQWYILSAEHGLLHPDTIVVPYERTLSKMSLGDRQVWGERVRAQLQANLPVGAEVLLLAGERYRQPIEPFLRDRGHSVAVPLRGLGIGQQLRWLKRANGDRATG
jgi:hypothetical protein